MRQSLDLLEHYMRSWVEVDRELFLDTLAPDVHIVECYGPEYRGAQEAARWFDAWNREGRVLAWKLLEHWWDPQRETLFATWEFHCDHPAEDEPCFDGVTLLRCRDGRIADLREYSMKHEKYRPYQL